MNFPGRSLLAAISRLIPSREREAWLREWTAELDHSWAGSPDRTPSRLNLYLRVLGSIEDALSLRLRQRNHQMLAQNIRYALRGLRRSPGFTGVVLATLALGIGANGAVFALVDAVLLRPLPVAEPEELVDVYTTCRRGYEWCSSSYPDYLDYRERNRSLSDLAAYAGTNVGVSDGESTRMAEAMLVTGNYFSLLAVGAVQGRMIMQSDDDLFQPSPVVVLSHAVWQTRFSADPSVIGDDMFLNGIRFTVVGVAPPGFSGTRLTLRPEFWIPMTSVALLDGPTEDGGITPMLEARGYRWMDALIGRRLAAFDVDAVRTDMAAVSQQLEEESTVASDGVSARAGRRITVEPTRAVTLPVSSAEDIKSFVWLLMGMVGAALLIACANIANLLLSRASVRGTEIGVRLALGAGRGQLMGQLFTESLLLASMGGTLGLLVARGILAALSGYSLPGFVSIGSTGAALDMRVLAFTFAVSALAAVLFGLVPALQASSHSITASLKSDGSNPTGSGMTTRNVLLAVQSGLALTLLVSAGLFLKSLQNGLATDVGYSTTNVAIASVDFSTREYDAERVDRFLDSWMGRTAAATGASSVTTALLEPMSRSSSGYFAAFDGYVPGADEEVRIEANFVGPDYFRTIGLGMSSGRDLTDGDRATGARVAVVNQTIADRYFGGANPVGATMEIIGWGMQIEIVGLVPDVNHGLREDQGPFVYFPLKQHMGRALQRSVFLLAATPADALGALPALRSIATSLDRDLPVMELTTMTNRKAEFLMPQRVGATMLSALGVLTALLTVIGIAGVVGFVIARRRREIGIRIALGADRNQVARMVTAGTAKPILAGLLGGLVASAMLSRVLGTFMYDMAPIDPATYVIMALALATVAMAAAYIPARRASSIDPREALRSE